MKKRIITVAMAAAALGMIGFGCWMAYQPAGLIVPGFLLWIDITRMSKGG